MLFYKFFLHKSEFVLRIRSSNSPEIPNLESPELSGNKSTVWDDEYLRMQAERPIGSPLELSEEEAKDVARRAFE